jgi:hypothetical protein
MTQTGRVKFTQALRRGGASRKEGWALNPSAGDGKQDGV